MKRFFAMALLLTLAVSLSGGLAEAKEPAEDAAKGKIRVLLTTGGHAFQEEPFYAMFDGMKDVEYTKAEMPKDAGLLRPGLEQKFDAIVMYDMCKPGISPEQQKAFIELLNSGIGLVSLHHNLGGHRDWDEFRNIIGGKFVLADSVIEGKEYTKSTWSHGEDLDVTVADKKHPITKGLKDFTIHDETYGGYFVSPDVQVLLTTDHAKNEPRLAWVKSYGNSRVFYLMLGHDGMAYENPNYAKLVNRGIRWAAGR